VDSLAVVEVICAIEELLGLNLPTSFAPQGGFEDVEECVEKLLSLTKESWLQATGLTIVRA
jgi:acyl carrier protein